MILIEMMIRLPAKAAGHLQVVNSLSLVAQVIRCCLAMRYKYHDMD